MDITTLYIIIASVGVTALIAYGLYHASINQHSSKHMLEVQGLENQLKTVTAQVLELEEKESQLLTDVDELEKKAEELELAKQNIAAMKSAKEGNDLALAQHRKDLSLLQEKLERQAEKLQELARSEQSVQALTENNMELKDLLAGKETRIESLLTELRHKEKSVSQLETQLHEQAESNRRFMREMQDAKTAMSKEFKSLAGDILEQKSRDFRLQHHESLEKILTPFKVELTEFKNKVAESQKEDLVHRSKLGEELKQLRKLNQQITDDADNLTKALKGEKKLQGNWGEIQLERILESSGLVKGQEFEREPNFKTDEGKNQRPDFIVKLPEGKHLIIDSKVSLNAFLEYCQADSVEDQERALKQHVSAMKNHIKSLNEKDYPSLTGLQSPDFVFMFVPVEPAFNIALQADFTMFEEAFAKHIVIVTPTTLLATLKTVSSIWTIERQNKKATELAERAGHVYDKLRGFLEKMDKLGSNLNTARDTFDDAMKTLRTGSGNLVRQAEQFKELGVRVKKEIPENILAKSDLTDSLSLVTEAEE